VSRYRTEIVIPPDRMITLHLPLHLPEGRAVVTVNVEEPHAAFPQHSDDDREDIEWWEEFEDGDAAPPGDDSIALP
jgi:hypothetical protein